MDLGYFVSDIHLKSPDEPNAIVFRDFLERLARDAEGLQGKRPTHLFLVGDIFDLWIGGHEYFVKRFEGIVRALQVLVQKGVQVHFFEGNHDLHLREFWENQVGLRVHADAAYFVIAGRRIRVEHGDLMNLEDKGYLFLRKFLRCAPMRFLALNLPSAAVSAIGERASRASRIYTSETKVLPVDAIRAVIRRHAERAYADQPFDLIISGHVHVKDDVEMSVMGNKIRSINLGSWYEPPAVFILSEAHAEFITLGAAGSDLPLP